MAEFQKAIDYVLSNEGGIVNEPDDPGGLTNWGISSRAYPDLDIRNLTKDDAIAIYERDYWRFDGIQNQRIATKLFDASVNMGVSTAVRLLQLALVVTADGILGPETLRAINTADEHILMNEFKARLAKYYCDDVIVRPRMGVDLMGWLRRAIKG